MVGKLQNPVPYSVRQLPVIGDLTARIGQVYAISGNPCNASYEIMVLAAFKNIPKLFWSLYKPDPLDKYFERFGTPHHKKRKKRFQVMDTMTGRRVGGNDKAIWASFKGAQLAQRIGWYFIVADATTEFAVNWTSTVYEWGQCPVPGTPYAEATAIDAYTVYDAGVHTSWVADIEAMPPFVAGHGFVSNPAGYDSACNGTFQWKSEPATGYPAGQITNIRMRDDWTGDVSDPLDMIDGANGTKTGFFQYRNAALINPARRFQFQFEVSEKCWINLDGTNLSLMGHKSRGILADP